MPAPAIINASLLCGLGVFEKCVGLSVSRNDAHLVRNAELFEYVCGLGHYRHIGVASHNDGYCSHINVLS